MECQDCHKGVTSYYEAKAGVLCDRCYEKHMAREQWDVTREYTWATHRMTRCKYRRRTTKRRGSR